ncbi:alpha/beta fold hydrolase [Vibrio hippocampi]|nr:alpha/beta hydrolase [Vibrio hippocampi]
MKQFVVDGQTMAYQDIGQGEVLLLGHHYLWDGQMWQKQVAELSRHYRCIIPDFWSHGQSQAAPQAMCNLSDYAQHIVALMDELSIESFSIIGAGAAGMWGCEVVTLVPQRVKKLALVNTFVGLEPEVAHRKYTAMLNSAIEERQLSPQMIDTLATLYFAQSALESHPELITSFKQYLSQIEGQGAVELAKIGKMIIGRRDLCEIVEAFALPTMISVGSEDKIRPGLESYLMNDLISGSALQLIPNAGHMSMLETPELLTQQLVEFLD